jgi:biotin carboxylase
VIAQDGNPMIIELAARLSGGWFATHQIPEASGVNLVKAVMLHALGEDIEEATLIPDRDKATAIRYWFPPHGMIQSIHGEDVLKAVPGLIAYGFFRKPGELQPLIKMHPDRFGYALVGADNREEALSRVKLAMESIQIEVSP